MEQQELKTLRVILNSVYTADFDMLLVKDATDGFVNFYNGNYVQKIIDTLTQRIKELETKNKAVQTSSRKKQSPKSE